MAPARIAPPAAPQRPRQQRRRAGRLLAAAAAAASAAGFLAASPAAWLLGASPSPPSAAVTGAVATSSEVAAERRRLLGGAIAAAAASAWSASPQAAEAFRADRILNAKKRVVPKIRSYYQKLEGLRDDLYLEVQYNADGRRVTLPARPADWYDGLDSKMDGVMVLPTDKEGFSCAEYDTKVDGVVLIPRGRCDFTTKVENAKAAGAKSVVVWDEKMSKMPLETQGKTGATRSKGTVTREQGDALTGGASILPRETGVTIMAPATGKSSPGLDAVMINLLNGTDLTQVLREGQGVKILDVKHFDFTSEIDRFVKKDLKKMLNEMEIYSNVQRESKDAFDDPLLIKLKGNREAFANAVKSKDYGAIRKTFKQWQDNLDPLGKWELTETY